MTLILGKDRRWRVSGYTQQDDLLPDGTRFPVPSLPVSPASENASEKSPLPYVPIPGVEVPKLPCPIDVPPIGVLFHDRRCRDRSLFQTARHARSIKATRPRPKRISQRPKLEHTAKQDCPCFPVELEDHDT